MTDMLNKALEPIRRAELLARKVKLPSYMWDTTGGLEALARFMKEAQRAEVDAQGEDYKALYMDLLLQVGNVHKGESRHQTARRYIIEAEGCSDTPAKGKEP